MAKIDLDALSIEELAALIDAATEKLADKVATRQAELEAELAQLARYGKVAKKGTTGEAKPKREALPKDATKDVTKDVGKDADKEPAPKAA
ncbi:hypothetical protein [Rhodopseudomonas sp. B29]|uniref:hypothetical protein n=1 Tax=Rhodopseudomonas sp. B29 TaxID=95607 RepID=UPI000348E556|nr:hypothetical protein [Rhodopseudomonas sp. B29]